MVNCFTIKQILDKTPELNESEEDPKGSEQPRTPWLNITKENHRPRRLDNRGDAEMASCGTYILG